MHGQPFFPTDLPCTGSSPASRGAQQDARIRACFRIIPDQAVDHRGLSGARVPGQGRDPAMPEDLEHLFLLVIIRHAGFLPDPTNLLHGRCPGETAGNFQPLQVVNNALFRQLEPP